MRINKDNVGHTNANVWYEDKLILADNSMAIKLLSNKTTEMYIFEAKDKSHYLIDSYKTLNESMHLFSDYSTPKEWLTHSEYIAQK